jgi:hypothetical protein
MSPSDAIAMRRQGDVSDESHTTTVASWERETSNKDDPNRKKTPEKIRKS